MDTKRMRRANVLAVDDQRANLLTLEAVLASEFNLILASSGQEAITILEARQDVDVILMDAQMPIMDGFEAAARIKKMAGCEDIPIVFITAVYNEDPFIKQGYKVGAVDYFSKPFDPEILKVKVGIYASFRQRADMLKERERQIRESEELLDATRRLSGVLRDPKVAVIVTDMRGRIRHATPEAIELSRALAPAIGATDTILGCWHRDGSVVEGQLEPFVRALAAGECISSARLDIPCAVGLARSIMCTASSLREVDGALAGAVLIIHDITAHEQMQTELERRIHRLIPSQAELATG